MKDQDIDNLFGSTLGDNAFPFEESAWASAEKAIIAHEASKRRRGIFLWFLSGLLLLTGSFGFYSYNSESEVSDLHNQAPKVQSANIESINEDNTNSISDNKSNSNKESSNPNSIKEQNPKSNYSQKSSSESRNNQAPKNFVAFMPYNSESKNVDDIDELNDRNSELNQSNILNQNRSNIDFISPLYANLYGIDNDSKMDESIREADDISLPPHWNTKINLIAGLLSKEQTNSEIQSNPRPYYVGIGISKIYSANLEFGAALLYEEIAYSQNEKTIEQVEYGFTKKVTRHSIQRLKGNYISLPFYVKQRIYKNHAVLVGLQYSRLLQSYSLYTTSSESNAIGANSNQTENNAKGFNKDLNPQQVSMLLGYDLTLSDKLRLQVQGRFGANSLYKNELKQDGFKDRLHLKLGLEYSLWRY